MNYGKLRNKYSTRKMALLAGISLLFLLATILLVTIYNINHLAKQADIMFTHPFQVVVAAGKISTDNMKMRVQTDRLGYDNSKEQVEEVEAELAALYEDVEKYLQILEKSYRGDIIDVVNLQQAFEELKAQHGKFIEFAVGADRERPEITGYNEQHLEEIYTTMDKLTDIIVDTASYKYEKLYEEVFKIRNTTIILAIIIIAATVIVILCYQLVMKRQNKEIEYKNKLFDLLSKTIDHAFIIYDPFKEHVDFLSENAERILKMKRKTLLNDGRAFVEYLSEHDRDKMALCMKQEDQNYWNYSITCKNSQDGRDYMLSVQTYRIMETGGHQFITVLTDETEDLRVQKELQNALLAAEKANKAKSEFLSRMSHEIRTPLNGVVGMTIVAMQNLDKKQKVLDSLKKITVSSKQLLVLINDVLDMSKIESGKIEIRKDSFDFRLFIETLTNVIYGQAREKGINYETVLVGDIEEKFSGDSLRLNQVLLNLLSNALKFTPRNGAVTTRISRLREDEENVWLRFEVTDTGCGIAEENYDKIFKAFEQENASITGQYGGTGLGLSISKRFVELMGGTIGVSSKVGTGTCFAVEVPLGKEDSVERQYPKFDKMHALIVDDDLETCAHASILLKKLGVESVWVDNGFEAVAQVERAHDQLADFDICFIDWKMPYIDGLETTRRIRKVVGKDMTLVLITAYDSSEIETEAMEAGADEIICKPLFESTIVDAFNMIGGKSRSREKEEMEYNFANKRVLIVEDNELNMEIATELVNMTNAYSECAMDGYAALEKYMSSFPHYYDLILMDVQMPGMDGYEVTRKIRASGRPDAETISILAMTADAFAEDVQKSMDAGMNGHINKPIDLDEMMSKMKQLLINDKE